MEEVTTTEKDNENQKNDESILLRQEIQDIYEYYAAFYPHPAFQALNQSLSAEASESTTRSGRSWSVWNSLFGSKQQEPTLQDSVDPTIALAVENRNNDDESLLWCGTQAFSDESMRIIPQEAHALARFCWASQSLRALNPCRPSSSSSSSTTIHPGFVALVGLGQVWMAPSCNHNHNNHNHLDSTAPLWTSDCHALNDHVTQQGLWFRLEYARGVILDTGSSSEDDVLLAVSWGLYDGVVQFYRRIQPDNHNIGWQAIATAAQHSPQDWSSQLLVTSLVPLQLESSTVLCITRLGGSLEFIPVSSLLLEGGSPTSRRRTHHKAGATPPSYATGMVNLASSSSSHSVVVVERSGPILGVTAWNVTTSSSSFHYMLVTNGGGSGDAASHNNHEPTSLSFWGVALTDTDTQVHCQLLYTRSLDQSSWGPGLTLFATPEMMRHWQPQPILPTGRSSSMEMQTCTHEKEEEEAPEEEPLTDNDTTVVPTTLTVPMPIVDMQACRGSSSSDTTTTSMNDYLLILQDAQGGITWMDCTSLVQEGNEQEVTTTTLVDRAQMQHVLCSATNSSTPCRVQAVQVVSTNLLANDDGNDMAIRPVLSIATQTHVVFCSLEHLLDNHSSPLSLPLGLSVPFQCWFHSDKTNNGLEQLQLVFQDSVGLGVAGLQKQSPVDIVETLEQQGKWNEALEAARRLWDSRDQHASDETQSSRLVQITDRIHQQQWLQEGKFKALQSVRDDTFVVEQVLHVCGRTEASMRESPPLSLEEVRSILQLGLERLEQRTPCSEKEQEDLSHIRSLLILLGTYRLLGRLVGDHSDGVKEQEHTEESDRLSSIHFFSSFVPNFSVETLAGQLAEAGNMTGLSLLLFRHWGPLINSLDWLQQIPPTLPVSDYEHCLPVVRLQEEVGPTLWFLTPKQTERNEGPLPDMDFVEFENLPGFLLHMLGLQVVLDDHDKKTVMDSIHECIQWMDITAWNASLEQACISRTRCIHLFTGGVEYAIDFSRVALMALARDLGDNPHPSTGTETLVAVHERLQILRGMLNSQQLSGDVEKLLPTNLLILSADSLSDRNDLASLCSITLKGGLTMHDMLNVLDSIRPLILSACANMNGEKQQPAGNAIVSYCLDKMESVRPSTSSNDGRTVEWELMPCLNLCGAFAFLSRTSLHIQDRMITEKHLLVEFVVGVVRTVFRLLIQSVDLEKTHLSNVIDILWSLYESLPIEIATGDDETMYHSEEYEKDTLLANELRHILAALEISIAWQAQDAQIACLRSLTDDKDTNVTEKVVSSLCSSFCTQIMTPLPDHVATSELLHSLISDIQQLIGFFPSSSVDASGVVTRELFIPLMKAGKMSVLATLANVGKGLYDESLASQAIISFTDDHIDSSREREPDIQAIAACWDALGKFFPHLESHFNKIQGYVDSAECLNNFPFRSRPIFTVSDVKEGDALEIIELLLNDCPESVVFESDEWADPLSAAILNNAIREITMDEHENQANRGEDNSHLPRLPGQAVFQLAEFLGLVHEKEVVAVKCRVAAHASKAGFHGASAALCRNLLLSDLMWSNNKDVASEKTVVHEISSIVRCSDYEDFTTKRELCGIVLSFPWKEGSVKISREYEQIFDAWASTEYSSFLSVDRESELRSLRNSILSHHSVDIVKLLDALSRHGGENRLDDDLLVSISRYIVSIYASGALDSDAMSSVRDDELSSLGRFCLSLMMQIGNEDTRKSVINEMLKIIEPELQNNDDPDQQQVDRVDEDIVNRLQQRGYSRNASVRAATNCPNASFNEALLWAVKHASEPDFNDPIVILKKPKKKTPLSNLNLFHKLLKNGVAPVQVDTSDFTLHSNHQHVMNNTNVETDLDGDIPRKGMRGEKVTDVFRMVSPRGLMRLETSDSTEIAAMRGTHRRERPLVAHTAAENPITQHPQHQGKDVPPRGVVRVDTMDSTELAIARGTPRHAIHQTESVQLDIHRPHLGPEHPVIGTSIEGANHTSPEPHRGLKRVDTADSTELAVARGAPLNTVHQSHYIEEQQSPHCKQSDDGSHRGLVRVDTADSTQLAVARGAIRHVHGHSNESEELGPNDENSHSAPQRGPEQTSTRSNRRAGRRPHHEVSEKDDKHTTLNQQSAQVISIPRGERSEKPKRPGGRRPHPISTDFGRVDEEKENGAGEPYAENQPQTTLTSQTSQSAQDKPSPVKSSTSTRRDPPMTHLEEDDGPLVAYGGNGESLVGKYLGSSISETLKRVSPIKLSPAERNSFRQRGQQFLHKTKGGDSPQKSERRRLIEQGRAYLVRARADAPTSVKTGNESVSATDSKAPNEARVTSIDKEAVLKGSWEKQATGTLSSVQVAGITNQGPTEALPITGKTPKPLFAGSLPRKVAGIHPGSQSSRTSSTRGPAGMDNDGPKNSSPMNMNDGLADVDSDDSGWDFEDDIDV